MECDFIGQHDVLRLIRKYFGTNVSQYLTYVNQVFENDTASGELEFKEGFLNWWKDNYKEPLDIKTITPTVLKNRIIKYYDYAVPNFSAFEEDNSENNKAMAFGYTSNIARKDAKAFIAHSIYVQYFYTEKKKGKEGPTNNLATYATNAIIGIKRMLAQRLAEELSANVNDIFNSLKTNSNDYLNNFINEDTPITTRNLIALYKELTSTEQIRKEDGSFAPSAQREFFDEVMLDSILSTIKTTNNDSFIGIDNELLAADLAKVETSDTNPDGINFDDFDGTIRDYSLHHGELSDYKGHIGERIKFLLNTIPKCKSTKTTKRQVGNNTVTDYDVDLDNACGLPSYMSDTEISTTLYSYVSRDDKESMLNDIKRLAEAMPGQAGLIRLYNTLMAEPDMAAEFFTNFAKHVIPKVQTVILDGNPIFRQSNTSASRLSTLRQEYISNYITAVVNADVLKLKQSLDEITYINLSKEEGVFINSGRKIKYFGTAHPELENEEMPTILAVVADETGRTELTDKAVDALYNILIQFFPSVNRISFENYIYQSGKTPFETINAIYSDISLAVKYAEKIQVEQKAKELEIRQAIHNNEQKLEDNLKVPGTWAKSDFDDVEAIRKKQVIQPSYLSAPQSFAEHMVNFTLVKLNLNSVNVHGNQVSSVLNSSLITRLKSIFESQYNLESARKEGEKSPLELFAEDYHLDQTTQFKLSNILIEQDGHAGLFRKDKTGKFVPTEYASELLSFTLFDGAVNQDTETPVLYSEMSKGDYIGTAWINYFDKEDTELANTGFKLGRYFLRIPSDAPKTFIIKAPRYAIDNNHQLFRTVNQVEYDNFINNVTDKITSNKSDNDLVQAMLNNSKESTLFGIDEFVHHILATGDYTLEVLDEDGKVTTVLPNQQQADIESNTSDKNPEVRLFLTQTLHVTVNGKDKTTDVGYYMKGKYNSRTGELQEASFDGFESVPSKTGETVSAGTRPALKEAIRNLIDNAYKNEFENKGTISYDENTITRQLGVTKDHQLFKQLKAAFKQELLDGVAAAKLMFKTELRTEEIDGKTVTKHVILTKDGKPVLKDEWVKDTNGLSPIYHTDEDGNVFEEGKLLGKVFGSDRFILFDEEDQVKRNYGQELIDSVVSYMTTDSVDRLVDWIEDSDEEGTLVDLNLSEEQEAAIDAKIEEYIVDFVNNSRERLKESRNFIKGTALNINNIADFMLNHQIMYINSNELLEGDTKYYKNVQTFLKRTKEYQASGNPYSLASTRRTLTTPLVPLGKIGWNIEARDRFYAVTIKNTNTFDRLLLNNLVKYLSNKDVMGEQAMSEKEAKAHIFGEDGKGGYTDAVVNDAQSYITFEEWVRRVAARGELDKYRSLIDKIVNGETLTVKDIDQFVQVQKNIYYDMYYDKNTKRVVPRQIKNAEFVLIPQFIEGTELETLYDFMRNNNIDQINTLETSKASNNYILDVFDENTGALKRDVALAAEPRGTKEPTKFMKLVEKAIQPYSYNYLYEQQRTPQHLNVTNKFAIQIAKKIIDNIPEGHPLYKTKQEYFKVLTTNIKESFISLMKELNVPLDANGNIDTSDPSKFEQIDYKKFNQRLREELSRVGVDDNTIDYVTLSDDPYNGGATVMPNYFGIMINKLESITQAVINRNITRQTLAGFHAAQITNIGFSKLGTKKRIGKDKTLKYHPIEYVNSSTGEHITEEEYNALPEEDKSKFDQQTQAFIEIALPYSAFGIDKKSEHYKDMDDDAIIKELEKKGLDKFIGYRIPTEGKQSIAVMKIARFLPDAYGSTIVVPDEWVPQTGSDMDIDSIYGVQFKTYADISGEVHKVKFINEFNENNWYNYVDRFLGGKLMTMTDEEFDAIKSNAKSETKAQHKLERKNARQALQDIEQAAYDELDKGVKTVIKDIHAKTKQAYGGKKTKAQYQEALYTEYLYLNAALTGEVEGFDDEKGNLKKFSENLTEKDREHLIDYVKAIVAIYNSLVSNEDNFDYSGIKSAKIKEAIDKYKEEKRATYENAALFYGLESLEDFLSKRNVDEDTIISANSKSARDNKLVQCMLDIMSSPLSLEENLARSNFDKIVNGKNGAVDLLRNPVVKKRRDSRSPYNFLDEAEQQEDAMQGYALKGFSVARDTLCSVCNTVRPTISSKYAVKITYDYSDLKKKEFEEKLAYIKKTFDKVDVNGKIITVTHNKFGWSLNNNKNIDNQYITVYSSETTAHILDAMKSGPVPNINKYTFGVYKTLVDVGSNYLTAVGFIMQPAVATINKYYNESNSIYAEDASVMYLNNAVRDYCKKLLVKGKVTKLNKYELTDKFLTVVATQYKELLDVMFPGITLTTKYADNTLPPINQKDLQDRLLNEDEFAAKFANDKFSKEDVLAIYDLVNVLQFGKINALVSHIGSVQQVINPDKFGAKQSIFDAERTFRSIIRYVDRQYTPSKDGKHLINNSVLSVNGKDILEAIYPGIYKGNATDVESAMESFVSEKDNVINSAYPPLCAHLKYGTATSIIVNRNFFPTQTPQFREFIYKIEKAFSGNYTLDEATYKDLRSYIIGALYKHTGFINTYLNWSDEKGYDYKVGDVQNQNTREYARIYGYGHSIEFIVQDALAELGNVPPNTPVKVNDFNRPNKDEIKLFIKLSPAQKIEFIRNKFKGESVFDYIDTRLETTINTRSARAGAQLISFRESSSDIDYIRNLFLRAFNSRNPLIALTAIDIVKYAFVVDGYRFTRNGISKIIPDSILLNRNLKYGTSIVADMNEMISIINETLDDDLLENYIRSNPNLKQITTKRVKKTKDGYELTRTDKGIIVVTSKELAIQYGIMNESNIKLYNRYVRLKIGDDITLYKIHRFNDNSIVLYPINDLERNETGVWSANERNNRYPATVNGHNYYLDLLREYMDSVADKSAPIDTFGLREIITKYNEQAYRNKSYNELKKDDPINGAPIYKNTILANTLQRVATEIANDGTKGYGFFLNRNMNYHMKDHGKPTPYNIPIYTKVNGKTELSAGRPFMISRRSVDDIYKYYANPNLDRSSLNDEQLDAIHFLEERISFNTVSRNFSSLYTVEELHAIPDNIREFKESGRDRVQFSTISASSTSSINNITKAASAIVTGVNYMGSITGDEDIEKLRLSFRSSKITSKYNIAEQHIDEIIIPAAKAIKKAVDTVQKKLENFIEKPDEKGKYYSILDEYSINQVKTNDAMEEKYLKAIMDPGSIESKFAIFRDLDIKAEDEKLQPYLEQIKAEVGRLRNLPIVRKAKLNYVEKVIDRLSDNPEIKSGAISVIDGMYKQSRLNALFNDIGEAPNPLVQVMMKRIGDHMRAREIQSRRELNKFLARVDEIKKRAREAGVDIDMDHIFDELGRFRRPYTDKLIQDRDKLRRAKDDAELHWTEVKKLKGELSTESIMAFLELQYRELEYNEWKAKHIEQEAYNKTNNRFGSPDFGYYNHKNLLIRGMIDNPETKYIYAIYEILRRKRAKLLNNVQEDLEDNKLDEEISDLRDKIMSLQQPYISNSVTFESTTKTEWDEVSSDNSEMVRRAWDDKKASLELKDYVEARRTLENKYFDYVEKYAFKKQVEDNLAIIQEAEQPVNGIPTTPSYILEKDAKYKKAKAWLRRNAERVYIVGNETSEDEESVVELVNNAFETLRETKEYFGPSYQTILRDNRDEYGDPNGIEISKNPIHVKAVKDAQDRNNGSDKENYFSDRRLINVALTDDLVYTETYWKGITGGEENETSHDNVLWRQTIDKINNLLAPYYTEIGTSDGVSRFIDWAKLVEDYKDDEQGLIDVLESLDNFYNELDNIPKRNNKSEDAKQFIEDNCITLVNTSRLNSDLMVANSMSKGRAQALLRKVLKGHSQSEKEANRYLYTTFTIKHKPGSAEYNKFVDIKKTKARAILNKYTYKKPTKYYYQAKEEALKRNEKEKGYFRKWYLDNHIYNPYTRKFEPIAIWMHSGVAQFEDGDYEWIPRYAQQSRQVRSGQGTPYKFNRAYDAEDLEEARTYKKERDFRNENYNPNVGHAENYISGSNPEYDNPDPRNEFEKELSNFLQETVYNLVEHKESIENKQFVEGGWAPKRMAPKAINMLGIGKALTNLVGWVDAHTGEGTPLRNVDYASDKVMAMPLTSLLKTVDSLKNETPKPYRENYPDEVEYLKAKKKYEEEEEKVRKQNLEVQKAVLDRDYITVIQDFIIKANNYNAIQHSKYLFYITSQLLHEYGNYVQQYGVTGDFITDGKASESESAEYVKKVDQYMVEQFDNIIKRYVFDEWKTPHGSLTRWMNILQSVTSAKFMMLNFKGGVANVTYGEVSVHSESHARESWNEKESIAAWGEYNSHIIDYMAHSDSDVSSSETGAIIKLFDVIDYDENNGVGHLETDLNKITEKIKKYAYSTQSAGEHALHNRALLAALRSHRLFPNPRHQEFNQPKYIYMNLFEYTQYKREDALKKLLESTPVENIYSKSHKRVTYKQYEEYKARMIADANKHKDFAWFSRDYVTEFLRGTMSWANQKEFNKITEELKKEAENEFYDDTNHPTMRSQFKLGNDGKWDFADNSLLKSIDVVPDGRTVSDAIQLIANFKGRVISINKKIHGSYDKMGRAKVENNWFGGVLMQYRKHIPIGLSKRYRSKGYFNETRGSVEIGSYNSLLRYLAIPFKKHQAILELSDEEVEAGIGIQNLIKEYLDFAVHFRIAYNTLPDFDKANIRRALSDFHAMIGALFACVALKTIATGADDDRDKWWYNFAFYQTDRLASESSQYMPWVLPQEARKTFRTPAAMFQGIDDVGNTLSFLIQYMMGGDDFSPVYESGVNAGKNKLGIYIQRNIPVWRGIRSAFVDINDNNKAYKAGKNVLGFVDTDKLAERVNEIFGYK